MPAARKRASASPAPSKGGDAVVDDAPHVAQDRIIVVRDGGEAGKRFVWHSGSVRAVAAVAGRAAAVRRLANGAATVHRHVAWRDRLTLAMGTGRNPICLLGSSRRRAVWRWRRGRALRRPWWRALTTG
ncbi:MAG: hypothetical protein AcusKO_05420 [Acuticoccus sp.]